MLSWMYAVLAVGCLIVFRDEGVQAVIACALLLLNSHINEEVEIAVDEEEMD